MSIKSLNPYLNFDGTAAKAIELYEKALGAKVENRMGWADAPGTTPSPETKNRVMHCHLKIGSSDLMISDTQPGDALVKSSNTHVALHFDDPSDMAQRFDALAAGGKVTMPLQDTFWGAKFGMLTDRFNIQWMFNCETKKS